MKVVQINATCGQGSTGKICVDISKLLTEQHIDNYILYCSGQSDYPLGIRCASNQYIKAQALRSRISGNYGFHSAKSTKKMIAELERIRPDVVHLHNIHGHDCNLEILFHYFKKRNIKLFWTFHDCWAFTAYCPHFQFAGCDRWKTGCRNCPQRRIYSWFFDRSKWLYEKKKALFSGLDLTIITPSQWLGDLVKRSFLGDYPVKVINNGIDLAIFQPSHSDFREKYGISKHMILGVAFDWGVKKGLDVFIDLSKRRSDQYQIVLVGVDEKTSNGLPENIISLHRTQNQQELARIYSAADLFVNPTREDTFPTVNIEALACGTPVLTFQTGGSPEIPDETCGSAVACDDIDALEREILRICEQTPYSVDACVGQAKHFDKNRKFLEYTALYQAACE